ncbi:energy transducer TonB, partial [Limobrevibacterium gyesilva]
SPAAPAAPGPGAPAPPSSAPAASAAPAAPGPDWQRVIAAWLRIHQVYPRDARLRGDEGVVIVRFTLDRDGHILDATIQRSSGHESLDAATLAMLRGAKLPPAPTGSDPARAEFTARVAYRLEQ